VPSLKTYEVMLSGVPLVVSDVAALKTVVRKGETALVCRAGDSESLAEEINKLLENKELAKSIGQEAQSEMLRNCTWPKVANELETLYLRCRAKWNETKQIKLVEKSVSSGIIDDKGQIEKVKPNNSIKITNSLPIGKTEAEKAELRFEEAEILLSQDQRERAAEKISEALSFASNPRTIRWAMRLLYDSAHVEYAALLAEKLEASQKCGESDARFIKRIKISNNLYKGAMAPVQEKSFLPVENRVANILAFSLPHATVGYATRSHGLALGIRKDGWDILPQTRPGFPVDGSKKSDNIISESDEIDGLNYRHDLSICRNKMTEEEYLAASVDFWEKRLKNDRVALVHAASNYVTALPPLIAARKLGLPFIYEVRGAWEVTRLSQDQAFQQTPKYFHMVQGEKLVIKQADHIFVLNQALKEDLIEKHELKEEKITVVPNCVDPEVFKPQPRDTALATKLALPENVPVIGYVGSLVTYEGLDDLLEAASKLKQNNIVFRLIMVGDGEAMEGLKHQVASLNLTDVVILTGRVPYEEVNNYYSLIDICPFPRKPLPVCELVSPLKPFEAMAHEKAVILSDTRALSEIVRPEETGLLFKKGDVESLIAGLTRLTAEPELRQALGYNARKWVLEERNWTTIGQICGKVYRTIIGDINPKSKKLDNSLKVQVIGD
jgi:glycosyltransferase involved in cell wall biosynthesis